MSRTRWMTFSSMPGVYVFLHRPSATRHLLGGKVKIRSHLYLWIGPLRDVISLVTWSWLAPYCKIRTQRVHVCWCFVLLDYSFTVWKWLMRTKIRRWVNMFINSVNNKGVDVQSMQTTKNYARLQLLPLNDSMTEIRDCLLIPIAISSIISSSWVQKHSATIKTDFAQFFYFNNTRHRCFQTSGSTIIKT